MSIIVAYIFETSGLRGNPTAYELGIAAAASLIVAFGLVILSLVQFWLSNRSAK